MRERNASFQRVLSGFAEGSMQEETISRISAHVLAFRLCDIRIMLGMLR